jgi:hypothetical protein
MPKKVNASASPITVYSTGVDRTHCSPSRSSLITAFFGASGIATKPLINTKKAIPNRYMAALATKALPTPAISMTPPANAGPMICPD